MRLLRRGLRVAGACASGLRGVGLRGVGGGLRVGAGARGRLCFCAAIRLAAMGDLRAWDASRPAATLSPSMVRANGSGAEAATLFGSGAAGGAEPRVTGLPHVAQKRASEMSVAPHFTQVAMAQFPTTARRAYRPDSFLGKYITSMDFFLRIC